MKKISIFMFLLKIVICTNSQNIGVLYSNDNITFESDDIEIALNCISIDSTGIENANSVGAIISGEIFEKQFSEPAVVVPCDIFIPQIKKVFQAVNNRFDIELSKGSYDFFVYNRTGNTIHHQINISNGKKYSVKYQMGHNSIICRKSSLDTNKYAIKYYGNPSFFCNHKDTVCFGNSVMDSMYPDSTLPFGHGSLIINVYRKEQFNDSPNSNHKRVRARLFVSDLLAVKDLTGDDNAMLLPEGTHNLFLVSDDLCSYGFKIYIQEKFVYYLNVFMGYSTLQ